MVASDFIIRSHTTYRYVSTYVSKRCRKTRDKFTRKIGLIQIFVHSFFYAGKKESQINTVHVDNRYFLQTHNTCFAAELTFYLFTLLRIQFARGNRFAMTIQFTLQDIWYSKSLVGKKYSIFFHNVPTLVGIFIILKDLFEFKKGSSFQWW